MLKINGRTISTPSDLKVGVMDLSKAERNAKGNMIIERVGTKRKLDMSWKYLEANDLSILLKAVSNVFFDVEYLDPQTNKREKKTFYAGDRNQDVLDYQKNKTRYKDIKFNIIER